VNHEFFSGVIKVEFLREADKFFSRVNEFSFLHFIKTVAYVIKDKEREREREKGKERERKKCHTNTVRDIESRKLSPFVFSFSAIFLIACTGFAQQVVRGPLSEKSRNRNYTCEKHPFE